MNLKRTITAIIVGLLFLVAIFNEIGWIEVDWTRLVLIVTIFIPLAKWAVMKIDPPEEEALQAQQKYLDHALSNLERKNQKLQQENDQVKKQQSPAGSEPVG